MDYDNIEIDFIKRTLMLVQEYNGQYDATFLINCCLGLLVFPKEKHFKSIPDVEIPAEGAFWGLSRNNITVSCSGCGYKVSEVVRRLRNGVCHFNVRSLPDDSGNISTLEIKDRGGFKAVLKLLDLKRFVIEFANHVIKVKLPS